MLTAQLGSADQGQDAVRRQWQPCWVLPAAIGDAAATALHAAWLSLRVAACRRCPVLCAGCRRCAALCAACRRCAALCAGCREAGARTGAVAVDVVDCLVHRADQFHGGIQGGVLMPRRRRSRQVQRPCAALAAMQGYACTMGRAAWRGRRAGVGDSAGQSAGHDSSSTRWTRDRGRVWRPAVILRPAVNQRRRRKVRSAASRAPHPHPAAPAAASPASPPRGFRAPAPSPLQGGWGVMCRAGRVGASARRRRGLLELHPGCSASGGCIPGLRGRPSTPPPCTWAADMAAHTAGEAAPPPLLPRTAPPPPLHPASTRALGRARLAARARTCVAGCGVVNLGVHADAAGLVHVGGSVHIDVADAVSVAQHRDLGVLLNVRHLEAAGSGEGDRAGVETQAGGEGGGDLSSAARDTPRVRAGARMALFKRPCNEQAPHELNKQREPAALRNWILQRSHSG